ncbi:hypothetical protein [Pyruvatibacter sp.]|uniref:TetR/AcrR family transcriptional regulator n=1 Tax=Pyruvatibacter sp. TaxID=1981328 RepID=UPI00326723A3
MKPDRRKTLCDAGIEVLARQGARGLTHHNVDDEAGVSRGSTSYYYRTRLSLTQAVMERIAELDMQDVQNLHSTQSDTLRAIAKLIHNWLSGPGLIRTRARHELFLIASREPAIAEIVGETRKAMSDSISNLVTEFAATKISEKVAYDVAKTGIWLVDGLMLSTVRENTAPPSLRIIQKALETNLRANLEMATN